eukprot:scaffold13304_cov112-Isochrysis_galbana.AAC.1
MSDTYTLHSYTPTHIPANPSQSVPGSLWDCTSAISTPKQLLASWLESNLMAGQGGNIKGRPGPPPALGRSRETAPSPSEPTHRRRTTL